jgi:nucleoside phosphorylase/CheY-like chemotaxis protein
MKVLIVDDNTRKTGKTVSFLESIGVPRESVVTATSVHTAKGHLRSNSFDLLLLDLLVPARDEDDPRKEVALEFVREINDRDVFLKPKFIVGFTAFAETAEELASAFAEMLWTIVLYDETSTSWQAQIRNIVDYLSAVEAQPRQIDYMTDLCIVTALRDPEMNAVHSLPWSWDAQSPLDETVFFRRGSFTSDGQSFSVVTACVDRMGSVSAALLSERLIAAFRPRFLVMVGICAGVSGRANLGDVVLFSSAWDWASGKIVAGEAQAEEFEAAPDQIAVGDFITSRFTELREDHQVLFSIRQLWPAPPSHLPAIVIAPGASGPAVVANEEAVGRVRQQHRKLAAIDMEVFGLYAAGRFATRPKPTTFAIKGVSDFADERKGDDWRKYAAYTSAAVLKIFFERYMATIHSLAGH